MPGISSLLQVRAPFWVIFLGQALVWLLGLASSSSGTLGLALDIIWTSSGHLDSSYHLVWTLDLTLALGLTHLTQHQSGFLDHPPSGHRALQALHWAIIWLRSSVPGAFSSGSSQLPVFPDYSLVIQSSGPSTILSGPSGRRVSRQGRQSGHQVRSGQVRVVSLASGQGQLQVFLSRLCSLLHSRCSRFCLHHHHHQVHFQ